VELLLFEFPTGKAFKNWGTVGSYLGSVFQLTDSAVEGIRNSSINGQKVKILI
jgi:hypothetical protein